MNIAFVGCGYVSDYYIQTLTGHPSLRLCGAYDINELRLQKFCDHHRVRAYRSLVELCDDSQVDLVVNLTNPASHHSVSLQCLERGKHVYSEKPLATTHQDAVELVEAARRNQRMLSAAPCSLLGDSAQTLLRAIEQRVIGQVYSVYAEMDDGLVHRMPYHKWVNRLGVPWPYQEEFESGCTWEHAAYYVSWLVAFFGPVQAVHAYASTQVLDKKTATPLRRIAPDFSVACLEFAEGVVARLTCSIIAPRDHSLKLHGEEGVLVADDCWHNRTPITLRRWMTLRKRLMLQPWRTRLPLLGKRLNFRLRGAQQMDFCRGIAAMAESQKTGVPHRLSPEFCLHVNEIVLAIQQPPADGRRYEVRTTLPDVPSGRLPPPNSRVAEAV
jgi:predicted dehydrogenase